MKLNRRELLSLSAAGLGATCLPVIAGASCVELPALPSSQPLSTGFLKLDEALDGGFRRGEVYAFFGKAGSGKLHWYRRLATLHNGAAELRNRAMHFYWGDSSSDSGSVFSLTCFESIQDHSDLKQQAIDSDRALVVLIEVGPPKRYEKMHESERVLLSGRAELMRLSCASFYIERLSMGSEFHGEITLIKNRHGHFGKAKFEASDRTHLMCGSFTQ